MRIGYIEFNRIIAYSMYFIEYHGNRRKYLHNQHRLTSQIHFSTVATTNIEFSNKIYCHVVDDEASKSDNCPIDDWDRSLATILLTSLDICLEVLRLQQI